MTSAAELNALIQAHIDLLPERDYVWHTGVYLQEPSADGCNWNISVNCKGGFDCGAVISEYLDELRDTFAIPDADPTAMPAHQAENG